MSRRTHLALHVGALAMMLLAAGCPPGGTPSTNPVISVIPAAFNFGANEEDDSFAIQNAGTGVLIWSITGLPDWITVSPTNGSTPVGGPTIIDISVDRAGLDPGTYTDEFSIVSNGGTRIVSVTMKVSDDPLPPTLEIDPTELDFGNSDLTANLEVSNAGQGTVNWTLTETIPWLTTSVTSGATSFTPTTVVVSVNRTGLPTGTQTAEIEFTSDGGDITVPVSITVQGPTPLLSVSPLTLNYGTKQTELQFTVRNTGTGTLDWTITETMPWLTLDVSSGTTTSETETITATVDRTGLASNDYSGDITVTAVIGGSANINVDMIVAPAQLVVVPTTLNFGKFATDKLLSISNGGVGTVNWTIDQSAFPAWLSLAPSAGSVTTETDSVIVNVDRTGLVPGNYTHLFTVSSDAGSQNVTVNMTVSESPVLTINTGFVNSTNNPLAPVGEQESEFEFTITNTGTGTLNWNIDPETFPDWLTMAPVAGEVQGAEIDTIMITVSRANLNAGGYFAFIPVTSNGGNKTLEVTMQVPLRPIIGVIPDNLDFGLTADTGFVSVANIGDAGTVLNFLVVTDRDWLFVSPSTGTSIGTDSIIKDWQTINVSIDRSELESTGAIGTITVYALDALGEINPDIAPETITVSVQATPLAFQTSLVRGRIPSMLRFTMVMRDVRDDSFLMDPDLLTDAFRIFEDGIQIEEPSETTQQVQVQNSMRTVGLSDKRIDLRIRTVLLLDYSGSMVQAAAAAGTDLQSLYELTGSQFIDDYFDDFANVERGFATMAIMEFHDRSVDAAIIQNFTSDPVALKQAIQNIQIQDNGASALLPAIDAAADHLVASDFPYSPFDDADMRYVAVFSDGRLTTPPGEIQDYIDVLVGQKARIVPVGWGLDVNHEPLARLASSTGGHYYLTKPDANDVPLVGSFTNRIEDLNKDLASHTVLSYVTLGEAENVPVRFDGALNDPNDTPDQGLIQGTLDEQNVNLISLKGDIKLGQISMRTPGIVSNATQVTLRADYMPRNVNRFQFTIASTEAISSVTLVPLEDGGLVEDWTLTFLGAGTYSLTSPAPATVLPYGAYGDLVLVNFNAVAGPFTMTLSVDNTIYSSDIEPKYFIYPDSIDIDTEPFLAPAHPTPNVSPSIIDFGTGSNSEIINIRNIGGSYPYGGTATTFLTWELDDLPIFVTNLTPTSGAQATTIGTDQAQITVNRTLFQGTYSGTLNLTMRWTDGIATVESTYPVFLFLEILPPVMDVNVANLNFGSISQAGGDAPLDIQITNTGQSTLDYAIVTAGLPAWLASVVPASGTAINGEVDFVTVTVDPTAVVPGVYNTTLQILSDGGNFNLPVSVTITP